MTQIDDEVMVSSKETEEINRNDGFLGNFANTALRSHFQDPSNMIYQQLDSV